MSATALPEYNVAATPVPEATPINPVSQTDPATSYSGSICEFMVAVYSCGSASSTNSVLPSFITTFDPSLTRLTNMSKESPANSLALSPRIFFASACPPIPAVANVVMVAIIPAFLAVSMARSIASCSVNRCDPSSFTAAIAVAKVSSNDPAAVPPKASPASRTSAVPTAARVAIRLA